MNVKKGRLAEDKAVEYLKTLNFKILDRNFYSKFGEIDIIATQDNILHFVEVKSGTSFNPAYNLTNRKLERILKTVEMYLIKCPSNLHISIDLITIQNKEIELFENITI